MVDRSGGKTTFGDIPLLALSSKEFTAWLPAECPLCAEGIPLVKPGTTTQATS